MSEANIHAGLIPLTTVEFFFYQREDPRQPANMQLELRVPGVLDENRLRAAVVTAFTRHPMTRARLIANGRRRASAWELMDVERFAMNQVVRCVNVNGDLELSHARSEFFSEFLDVHDAPALRFLVVHRMGGDTLLMIVNHTVSDGAGGLRFMQSVARAYADNPDPLPDKDPIALRNLMNEIGVTSRRPSEGRRRRRSISTKIRPRAQGAEKSCYGFHHIALTETELQSLDPRHLVPEATLNDLLLGAFLRTIDAWNARRAEDDCNVVIAIPYNPRPLLHLRPSEFVVNMSMAGRLIAGRDQLRDQRATMNAVVEQTKRLKDGGVDVVPTLPGWAQALVVAAMPVLKHWGRPTAFFTYLGRCREVDFGPSGTALEVWVSGGTGMPTGLLIGAATMRGALYLTFCYRHALFDDRAAEQFASLYRRHLFLLGDSAERNTA